jgi:hypothetical protein
MIASISQGGAAFRDGTIRVGDVLDAVNGQPLQGLDLVEVLMCSPCVRARVLPYGHRFDPAVARNLTDRPRLQVVDDLECLHAPIPECEYSSSFQTPPPAHMSHARILSFP